MKGTQFGLLGFGESRDSIGSCSLVVIKPDQVEEAKMLSYSWRVLHVTLSVFGAVAFVLGSIQYFPSRDHPFRGSALFTMGAVANFFGDLTEFWIESKLTLCICKLSDDSMYSIPRWLRTHEVALNSLLKAVGALSYLIGCILFIPQLGHEVIGDIIFIPGSCIILISEGWEIYRAGCTVRTEDGFIFMDQVFRFKNVWTGDLASFWGNVCIWLGAALFLAGSVLFLPAYDVSDYYTDIVALIFVVGSLLFLAAACCQSWTYFYSGKYDRTDVLDMYEHIEDGGMGKEEILPQSELE